MSLGVQSARKENCHGSQTATSEELESGRSRALTLERPLVGA
jgi:hypothetical protein